MIMFPIVEVADLRRRLKLPAGSATDADLQGAIDTARAIIDPKVDPMRLSVAEAAYREGLIQLAVKVWDTGARGAVSLDAEGGFDLSTAATSGLYRSVLGVLSPVLTRSGVVIA